LEALDPFIITYLGLSLLCGVIILIVFPKLKDELRVLGVYFICSIGTDTLTALYASVSESNLHFIHWFIFAEFVILVKVFSILYSKRGISLPLPLIVGIGGALIIANSIFWETVNTVPTTSFTIVYLLFILCNLYFFSLLVGEIEQSMVQNALKWIMIAVFLYHCVSILVIFMHDLMEQLDQKQTVIVRNSRVTFMTFIRLIVLIQFARFLIPQKSK